MGASGGKRSDIFLRDSAPFSSRLKRWEGGDEPNAIERRRGRATSYATASWSTVVARRDSRCRNGGGGNRPRTWMTHWLTYNTRTTRRGRVSGIGVTPRSIPVDTSRSRHVRQRRTRIPLVVVPDSTNGAYSFHVVSVRQRLVPTYTY